MIAGLSEDDISCWMLDEKRKEELKMGIDLFFKTLGKAGLGLISKVIAIKGTSYIKEKTGIDLDEREPSESELKALKGFQSENQVELLQIVAGERMHDEEQRTERHKTDMVSDSKMSKNIRPLSLVSLLVFLGVSLFTDVAQAKFDQLVTLLQYVFAFYFIGRSTEKVSGGGLSKLVKKVTG